MSKIKKEDYVAYQPSLDIIVQKMRNELSATKKSSVKLK